MSTTNNAKKMIKEREEKVGHAFFFAEIKHEGQKRKDERGSPYTDHLRRAYEVLFKIGVCRDTTTLVAAILHDTLEDTETTYDELVEHFGEGVASVVAEVTDDKGLEKHVRKEKQKEKASALSREACFVKLADKIANVEDVISNPAVGWSIERRREYVKWASEVVENVRVKESDLHHHFLGLVSKAKTELV